MGQHPNNITMPYELLHHQAAQDMVPLIIYLSNNHACDIHQDDFCRNILSDPDVIQAFNNVYFWSIGVCPESTEIQRTVLQLQQNAPLLAYIIHNASGTQMTPGILTDLTSAQGVIDFINTAVNIQQDHVQLRRTRELRAEQDAEYMASLERDRERARQREEERAREEEIERGRLDAEARQMEEDRAREEQVERERLDAEQARLEAQAQLPPEPIETETTITLKFRGLQGQLVQRTFNRDDTTQILYRAVYALIPGLAWQQFQLRAVTNDIVPNDGSVLSEHGLANNSIAIVEDTSNN